MDCDDIKEVTTITGDIEEYLKRVGKIFREFTQQDSGCIAYGIECNHEKVFVKYSLTENGIQSLHRAKRIGISIKDPILPAFLNFFELPNGGIALVYEWVDGENLYDYTTGIKRSDVQSAHYRFRKLPIKKILAVINQIYEFHQKLEILGKVAVDFYDGCILYNFALGKVYLVDLDEYRDAPFILQAERLPGSKRFMAPEEFQQGAHIDHQTNVYTLGRLALHLLSDGTFKNWRGNTKLLEVIKKAVSVSKSKRFGSIEEFYQGWSENL